MKKMKKMFAALAAAAMLCCTLVSPVSAEETCLLGDVNFDGVVDCADAQILLKAYAEYLAFNDGFLTPEQRQIGNVDGKSTRAGFEITAVDAMLVLQYYAVHMVNPDVTMEDVAGLQPVFSEAVKEFVKIHRLIWDDEINEFVIVER